MESRTSPFSRMQSSIRSPYIGPVKRRIQSCLDLFIGRNEVNRVIYAKIKLNVYHVKAYLFIYNLFSILVLYFIFNNIYRIHFNHLGA
jgi:hypothetical protein